MVSGLKFQTFREFINILKREMSAPNLKKRKIEDECRTFSKD